MLGNQAIAAQPDSQVEGERAQLAKAVETLEMNLAGFETRLSNYVRCEVPVPQPAGPQAVQSLVPHADRLRGLGDRVQACANLVSSLSSRFEG